MTAPRRRAGDPVARERLIGQVAAHVLELAGDMLPVTEHRVRAALVDERHAAAIIAAGYPPALAGVKPGPRMILERAIVAEARYRRRLALEATAPEGPP